MHANLSLVNTNILFISIFLLQQAWSSLDGLGLGCSISTINFTGISYFFFNSGPSGCQSFQSSNFLELFTSWNGLSLALGLFWQARAFKSRFLIFFNVCIYNKGFSFFLSYAFVGIALELGFSPNLCCLSSTRRISQVPWRSVPAKPPVFFFSFHFHLLGFDCLIFWLKFSVLCKPLQHMIFLAVLEQTENPNPSVIKIMTFASDLESRSTSRCIFFWARLF